MPQTLKPRVGFHAAPAAWLALALLTALNLLNYLDRYILPSVQPLIQQEFRVSDAAMGALTSAFFYTYMLAAPATGWLGDRFARKPLLIAGALLWSGVTLLTAWVHTYPELYFRHAVVGIGEATFGVFGPALLSDFFPEEQRNRVLSLFYIAIPVGSALGYLTGGTLGPHYGWRMPFLLAAAPGIVLALLLLWVREPARGSADRNHASAPEAKPTLASLGHNFLHLFLNPAYLAATLGMATMVFAMGGISVWMSTFLSRYAGYSLGKANMLLGGITVLDGILGTLFGGWVAQRWLETNHRALYLLSGWSALLTIPFGALAFFGPRWILLPSLLLAEFFLFLNTGPLNAAIVNSVGAEVRATAIAVNLFLIHALGDASSPTVIGWVSDRSNLRVGMGLTLVALVVSTGILMLGARFAPRFQQTEEVA